ncbi:MAG: FecR domain-containing protein, partial [Planctomycetaceae bacterium]|nr:FecR domain-containing protein [Planctomycetaceae bacterium]
MACPDAETLAALSEGRLTSSARESVLDHAASCDECRHALLVLGGLKPALATRRLRAAPRAWLPWAAAAAIFAVCVAGVLLTRTEPKAETAVRPIPHREEPAPQPSRPETPKPAPRTTPDPAVPDRREEPALKPTKTPEPAPAPEVPAPSVPEKPPPPAPPAPAPEPAKPPTITIVAVLTRFEGDIAVLRGAARVAAKPGQDLQAGDGLECRGPRSWAVLSYPDRTRIEVEGDTLVRELRPREAGKGYRVDLDRGAVRAEVAKQPAGQPLLFGTPSAEAKVVGTVLRLAVDGGATRLDVEEGKVELKNAAGRSVLVEAGHFAVAAAGAAPAAKRFPKEEFLLAVDFEDGRKPASFTKS